MAATPQFFIFFDQEGHPIRYEAGYFVDPTALKYGVQYPTKEAFLEALGTSLEYTGYTSKQGSAMDMLAELFGEDELSVESAEKLRSTFKLSQAQIKATNAQADFMEEVVVEAIIDFYNKL